MCPRGQGRPRGLHLWCKVVFFFYSVLILIWTETALNFPRRRFFFLFWSSLTFGPKTHSTYGEDLCFLLVFSAHSLLDIISIKGVTLERVTPRNPAPGATILRNVSAL